MNFKLQSHVIVVKMLHMGREGSCNSFFLWVGCVKYSNLILVCESAIHELIRITQLLRCCVGNVESTGKYVTAFMLCHSSRELCLDQRSAQSERGLEGMSVWSGYAGSPKPR